tara:strand:+ start:49 stop:198 length:150 start_codon:yes stop_codon:yes gene_type:complete
MATQKPVFSISNFTKWKKQYESGGSMRNLPKEITIGDLKKFMKLYKKKN